MRNPLHFLRRRRRDDADFSSEITAHLALETDRLVAEGMPPADAAFEAHRRFGNVRLAQESFHTGRTIPWVEGAARHLRRAARRLVRAPVFAATAMLTLMLGIGATTAVFSLVDSVLLRPLPFTHPAQLVDLSHSLAIRGISHVDQSDATYLYYREANHVFSGVGAYRTSAVNLSTAGAGDRARAERVDAARASASLFAVLGIAPLKGRVFRDAEDQPGATPVVMLGERLWRTQYGSDPHMIGRTVVIDGVQHEVVGIMPDGFAFPDGHTALWIPIGIDPAHTRSAAFDFRAVARLRPGVTPDAAARDLQTLLPHVPEAFPGRLTADAIAITHMRADVHSLRDTIVGNIGRTLWVVFGAAAFLLLVSCANVANLFLVRAEERQHELVVRRALGAGRGVVVAEFLSEALLLAVLGGVSGIALAAAALGALRSMPSGIAIPRLATVGLDGTVLAVAIGVTLLTALVMSLVPAVRSCGPHVASVLVQNGRGTTAGRSRLRARRVFVVVQVALALVLVTGAGLMARSFRSLRSVPPGFDANGSYTFRVALPDEAYPTTSATVAFVARALEAIAALPDVQSAGVLTRLPLDDEARRDTAVFVEDRPLAMREMPDVHQVAYATPGTFSALGIPFVQGHTFEPPDAARAPLEVIVTHALAARYWSEGQAVGQRLRLSPDGPWFTVIGITGDVRGSGLDQPPDETVYLPLVTAPGPATATGDANAIRWAPRELAFVVRSRSSAHDITMPVERVLQTLAPSVPVYAVHTMRDMLGRSTSRTSFTLALLEIASIAAMLIGAVGLYGVVSYMVSLRAREMAVRTALGAQPAALRRLVLTQAIAVAAFGIVLGVGAALLLMRFLAALLFEVAPNDPTTLLAAVAVMAIVAVMASWFPARRAAATDPAAALRADV
ncbi:MAG TPA: ABC transporter permease [Gemmatimonadaceae bacterium]|nr:ABC transporter permease [Gemmatimonadaceae bacterium]